MKLIMKIIDDENREFWLGDHEIIRLNHDEDGWNGMQRIEHALTTMADILEIEFVKE